MYNIKMHLKFKISIVYKNKICSLANIEIITHPFSSEYLILQSTKSNDGSWMRNDFGRMGKDDHITTTQINPLSTL